MICKTEEKKILEKIATVVELNESQLKDISNFLESLVNASKEKQEKRSHYIASNRFEEKKKNQVLSAVNQELIKEIQVLTSPKVEKQEK